jgi:hypothetical protein
MPFSVAWAEAEVERIEREQQSTSEPFSESRWPYTYAYDYMRTHNIAGAGGQSRSYCGLLLEKYFDKEDIARTFAFAFCREHRIEIPVRFETGV